MKIALVGNFALDRQHSMLRFSRMLEDGLTARGDTVHALAPVAKFANLAGPYRFSGLPKYLGYIDKFVLFPRTLRKFAKQNPETIFHITDHSNAFYASALKRNPFGVTCHDLLPLRCARGEISQQRLGWSGRRLQESIWKSLRSCRHIACVSEKTRADLRRFGAQHAAASPVIYNGLNHPYRCILKSEATGRLKHLIEERALDNFTTEPFLLSVGDSSWYKNREGILQIFAAAHKAAPALAPRLVMVGAPLADAHVALATDLGIAGKITHLSQLSSDVLEALYNLASALIFPSWEEGFGWPIIEAQSCGCLVLTSNRAPMTEVGGNAALYADPANPKAAAETLLAALRTEPKDNSKSVANAARFSTEKMMAAYIDFYAQIAAAHSR